MIPLHLAINVGNFDIVQELVQCHIPEQLNAITVDYQDCALHLAARRSDLDVVQFLIDNGATVNQHNVSISLVVSMFYSIRPKKSCNKLTDCLTGYNLYSPWQARKMFNSCFSKKSFQILSYNNEKVTKNPNCLI